MLLLVLFFIWFAEGVLNVHLVPHTHDDVGWLKTVDQYYYGANNSIQRAGVQYIIDNVVVALEANPDRKFIYVEQAFFQRWWREQTDDMKNRVKTLVASGQLEFVNGGWCMHDEASTHYIAMVDQTTVGHKYIKDIFGAVPKAGWQIDPFGHSSTQAALLSAEVGFESLFFARIDFQDKATRELNKAMEMIWRASPSYGSSADVFTGAFVVGYGPPSGFCYDENCGDVTYWQDDKSIENYNVPHLVDRFVAQCEAVAAVTAGNDIMFEMGSDFNYANANMWFKNLDKLIKYVNQDGRVNVFYSTPSIYASAKINSGITWPVKTDDFFPYADCPHCMWTGYFVSRPALKRQVRITSNLLNTIRQIETFSFGDGSQTQSLWEADGVSQHHDGVSGTSKQHVAYDYARQLSAAVTNATSYANSALSKFMSANSPTNLAYCHKLNESVCATTQQNNGFVVVIYNPLARERSELIQVPISDPYVVVYDFKGDLVTSQVVDTYISPVVVTEPPAPWTLNFIADLPALGYTSYFVQPAPTAEEAVITTSREALRGAEDDVVIGNEDVSVTFDSETGRLKAILNKLSHLGLTITQETAYYKSASEPVISIDPQSSGAYIFRPNGTEPLPISRTAPVLSVVTGPVISEVRQNVAEWFNQATRIVHGQEQVEFHYNVGSIPIDDGIGKEVILRYVTEEIASDKTWYTDSNGREFLQRIKDYRPTWNYEVFEPVSGNYYPMDAAAYIKDTKRQMTILNDRSQGVASLNNGQIEIMVHRRTLRDDSRGVGEPINETQGITPEPQAQRIGPGMGISGTHYLLLDTPSLAAATFRPFMDRVYAAPYIAFAAIGNQSDAVSKYIQNHMTRASFSQSPLPPNIQLMTLQPWNTAKSVLLRLSHQFAVNEDFTYSAVTSVDLTTLFSTVTIASVEELSLTANQNKTTMLANKKHLKSDHPSDMNHGVRGEETIITYSEGVVKAVIVSLGPMEIKTFAVTFA